MAFGSSPKTKASKPSRATPPKNKIVKEKMIAELLFLVESGEIYQYSVYDLMKKYRLSRQKINTILEDIYKNVGDEHIQVTKGKLQATFRRIFNGAEQLIKKANTNKEEREAYELMLKTVDKFTAFLENFHIKEKATENIVITEEKQLLIVQGTELDETKTIEIESK